MSLVISDATVIDAVANRPRRACSIWIEKNRIQAIGTREEIGVPTGATRIDGRGKYVIPGLMNATVHLFCDIRLEFLAAWWGRYEAVIEEAAQIALKNGLTTVFDTWGPRRPLMVVRDAINAGKAVGSRMFCAGNIVGFDGPLSPDFGSRVAEIVKPAVADRINALWVENVGRHLMWLSPQQVAQEVRTYIGKGLDFLKYGANEHATHSAGAFLAFSERAQSAIVEQAHEAGITAQAHSTSIEGLRMAVEAGCDLVTHCNITGPVPIPESTLELMAKRKTGAVIFPWTQAALDEIARSVGPRELTMWGASDINARNLIHCGAPILMANDGNLVSPEASSDPKVAKLYELYMFGEDGLFSLATGHFAWFKAMEEKGCPPMEMLRAATRNIAVAYGKETDFGTIEVGKVADLLILDSNPLEAAKHYRAIHSVIKDGVVVDREALPTKPILTLPLDPPSNEQSAYIPAYRSDIRFPMCMCCR
jgi:imidazolonepropionase-like amidohydrolase